MDTKQKAKSKLSWSDMEKPLVQPDPSELIFRNFTPTHTYKLQLQLHNNDKVSRQVKPEFQESQFFKVVPPKNAGRKVAPGMAATYTICFTPQEHKDYQHTLVFVTDRESLEVPVLAIGPRAVLDFKTEYRFPTCAVKGSTEMTHLVRNVGNGPANFTLVTQRPFSVTPPAGTLGVFESTQVTVVFSPMTVGEHSRALTLHYHTGEDVHIRLHGSSEEVDVHLEPDLVHLTQTYISLSTVNRTVSLINKHNVPLRYCWTTVSSKQELNLMRRSSQFLQHEEQQERRNESDSTEFQRLSALPDASQGFTGPAEQDLRLSCSHGCITVEPAEGEVWPNIPVELNIVFKPEEAKLYQETIYCDITGRESTLALTIMGDAMGPDLQPNYSVMDMGNIFMGSNNCYEVQLSNIGLIEATFTIKVPTPATGFGGCFSIRPDEGVVPPGGCHTVQVSFLSHTCGSFSERLLLTVMGNPDATSLTFRGRVIGPTFDLSVSDLNFGVVAFGFPKTLSFSVFNTSRVTLTFTLRVLGDGRGSSSVSYEEHLSDVSRNHPQFSSERISVGPAEFTISPSSGSVSPQSHVTIQVTLCANTLKTYRLALVVDVEGVGEEIRTLPINARCGVPDVVLDTPRLDFKRCFLNQPCEQRVLLTNTSELPACYSVLEQAHEGDQLKLSYISKPKGVIGPGSSLEIPVLLLAKATGTLQHTLRIAVFGSIQPPLEVIVSCIGQGPIVESQNQLLDFGKVLVLKDKIRTLELSNKSPIPAHFTASLSCTKSLWRVEPAEGDISPWTQLELKVVAHLNDTLKFKDLLKVSVQHGQTHTIALSATGIGSPVMSDKPFAPSIDLGTHLSPGSCHYNFRLTNHGQQTRRLYWGPDSKPEIRGRRSALHLRGKPVFRLVPSRVELFPGSSCDLVLMGSSDSPKVVHERLICRTMVDGHSSYEHIHSVDVTCSFRSSLLNIFPEKVNFYMEKVLGQNLKPMYEKLVLNNVSSQSLSLELCLVKPFSLCESPGACSSATTKTASLGVGEQTVMWICFNPPDCLDLVSQVLDEVLLVQYLGYSEPVKLHAELHFPNLHFSSTVVDFGYVLNNSETQRQIVMRNCSPLAVTYRWTFLKELNDNREIKMLKAAEEENGSKNESEEMCRSSVTIQLDEDEDHFTQSTGKVFDIVPYCGHLQPGKGQQVTVSFYAQENTRKDVLARCHIEGGPTYGIRLVGEATVISYSLDSPHVDFGLQLFNKEAEAEVTLTNTGKVGFEFCIGHPQRGDEAEESHRKIHEGVRQDPLLQEPCKCRVRNRIRPGQPLFIPDRGHIDASAEQRLRVFYLPGVPGIFKKQAQLKVATLPAQNITLTGEGVPPTVRLNLSHTLCTLEQTHTYTQPNICSPLEE
ncbi:hydrocephalus-inducing protein homolog isoform X4 [Takifugu flavidus]|uniref:hydrocephalus-inducing protein homolog isoform X4 n=1 Tax=Takifugu flavidus TaxID=433684 RepID=UPI0025442E5D|nr:hydrocephalus-inducing protein homolog isoform X4 [Takifugu flavidus]XP_056908192.1 hydrocephalus-inducing protein homolog isoform X4 [Takifugu flavidus]XP_056908193.1 hydrocephalus-inducing protein homolog isoform X4 [Takifugu flavidus]